MSLKLEAHQWTRRSWTVSIFKAKLDVSKLSFDGMDANMKEIEKTHQYWLWDRNILINHFVIQYYFRIKGTESQYSNQPCILEDSRSAGINTVIYVKNVSGFTVTCKYYEKIVSKLELRDVHKHIGVYLAEYVNCPI